MSAALEYLRKKEWSMGNGQCPECYGVPEDWHGHPLYMESDSIGHENGCKLSECLLSLGEHPLVKGEYKTKDEYERFVHVSGAIGTRLKT